MFDMHLQTLLHFKIEIETKELCFWTIPIPFENILEGTYLHA